MIKSPLPREGQDDAVPSVTSQAYARLREDILVGRLEPGSRLKIDVLRASLGTGASPIREALSLLTSDHLVERIDQRGFRVAHVSVAGFEELLLTRAWLEERALRESIARGDKGWEEAIVLAHYHLSRTPRDARSTSADASMETEWERCHRAFHVALLGACGSSIMLRFCDQLYDQNIRYRSLSRRGKAPRRDIDGEHARIMECALDRDADAAVDALLAHYRRTGDFLATQLERGGGGEVLQAPSTS